MSEQNSRIYQIFLFLMKIAFASYLWIVTFEGNICPGKWGEHFAKYF